ncbi:hypothetical protein FQA39_LY01282 [Lamprigera yunnana]|nr:hypothetical protein FQA39_LY01282 [Lamprigera yunnana]
MLNEIKEQEEEEEEEPMVRTQDAKQMEEPTKDETSEIIKKLKNNKRPGTKEITVEILKYGEEVLIKTITKHRVPKEEPHANRKILNESKEEEDTSEINNLRTTKAQEPIE